MYHIIPGFQVRDQLTNRASVDPKETWWTDVAGPHLSDEVDEQAWEVERMRTKPQGEMNAPAVGPCWRPSDYAEMAQDKAISWISDGAAFISKEKAIKRFCEAMRYSSEPITVSFRPSPWDLRGDRVVVPEPSLPPTEVIAAAFDSMEQQTNALIVKVDAFIVGVQKEIVALSEVDPEITLQYNDDALLASRRPGGVTDTEDDEEDEEEERSPRKPVVKPAEPPFRPLKDDWGFPISYPTPDPAPGSEPQQPEEEPVPEEPSASPPSDQLGTDGSAATAAKGTGSSNHYESIDASLRDATIQEKGMKTRIQLTTYIGSKYMKGQSDDFRVPDITAAAVCAILSLIKRIADERHQVAIGAGTALSKGGRRIRIQMTEYTTNGGEYLKGKPENLSIPDMDVKRVAELVDHQLAVHFGVRRGDAKMLVRAWQEFTRETVEGSAGPADGASAKDKRGAFDLVAEKSSNTAQGALLDGYGDAHMATETTSAVMRPSLLSRGYDKKVHLGMCAVVVGTDLRVISLWGAEGDAKVAAKRVAGARVVDSQGYLIPKAEVEATPEVAPDEVVLGVPVLPVQV
jgi:hypothetical protein